METSSPRLLLEAGRKDVRPRPCSFLAPFHNKAVTPRFAGAAKIRRIPVIWKRRRVGKGACSNWRHGALTARDFARAVKRRGRTAWAKAHGRPVPVTLLGAMRLRPPYSTCFACAPQGHPQSR